MDKDKWNEAGFTWTDSLSKFKETGSENPILFYFSVSPDFKNHTGNMIHVSVM